MFFSLKPFSRLIPTLVLLTLAGAPSAFAHATGASKTTVRIQDNDSIQVTFDLNPDEMYAAVNISVDPNHPTAEQIRRFQAETIEYLMSHISLRADGRSLDGLHIISWRAGDFDTTHDLASDPANFWTSGSIFTFGGRLPQGTRTLRTNILLFQELGLNLQPISEVSLYWHDRLIERRWLGIDKSWNMPVSADSLQARLNPTHESAASEVTGLVKRFLWLGYTHILPYGIDHILFVLGLFFFSTRMRSLLTQITAFTIAHSITLGIAMVGIFKLPSSVVEPLIALSIAIVGLENVFFRKVKASRWLIVFAFGLIHGMGFAGVLSELGLPEGRFWETLLSFNLGVEFGQLTVVAAAFALTFWMRKKSWYFKGVVVPVSLAISAVGLFWAVQRAFGL